MRRLVGKNEFDCDDVHDNCSEYVDDEMPAATLSKFRSHMDACTDCNAFVSTFRATVMTLRDLPRRSAGPELQERIKTRIEAESESHSN